MPTLAAAVPRPPWSMLCLDVNTLARHTPWLHRVMTGYAAAGVVLFAGLLLAAWWIARRTGTTTGMVAALWAPIGMLLAVAVNQPIVASVDEARPYTALPHLVLATRSTDPSFASDHATTAGPVTAGLFLVSWRIGTHTAIAALLEAFAGSTSAPTIRRTWSPGSPSAPWLPGIGYLLARRPLTAVSNRQRNARWSPEASTPTWRGHSRLTCPAP